MDAQVGVRREENGHIPTKITILLLPSQDRVQPYCIVVKPRGRKAFGRGSLFGAAV